MQHHTAGLGFALPHRILPRKLSWVCVCREGHVQVLAAQGMARGPGKEEEEVCQVQGFIHLAVSPRCARSRWGWVGSVGELISLWQGCVHPPQLCTQVQVKVFGDVPCHSCLSLPCRHQHGWGAQTQQTQRAEESSLCLVQVGVHHTG